MNNNTTRVNITMIKDLKDWYKKESSKHGLSMSTLMMIVLKEYYDKNKE